MDGHAPEFHRAVGRDVTLAQCPISGLPASATHIDYALGALGPGMEYEFDTSEADFRRIGHSPMAGCCNRSRRTNMAGFGASTDMALIPAIRTIRKKLRLQMG